MNLYLRLIRLLLKALFAKKIDFLEKSSLPLRVWPWDCDINFHLTNSRYLAFMDLGRTFYVGQVGILSQMVKKRWFPAVHATEIVFIRPISPMQKIEVVTRVVSWDEKAWYFEQRFESGGKLYAVSLVKGVLIHRGHRVATKDFFTTLGIKLAKPEVPTTIKHWLELLRAKREQEK